jgi:hypothetical protein
MYTKFWLESLKGRDHSEDLGVYGRNNIRVTNQRTVGSGARGTNSVEEMRNAYKILDGKPEEKILLGRSLHR